MLKAKTMQITPGTDPELVLSTIQRAVNIQESVDKDKPSVHLGRFLYFMGTVYMGLERTRDTLNCFLKSSEILKKFPEYAQLVEELQVHIDNL